MTTIYSTPTSLQRLDADGGFDEAQLAAARSLLATAAEPLTPIATIFAASSSGRPMSV